MNQSKFVVVAVMEGGPTDRLIVSHGFRMAGQVNGRLILVRIMKLPALNQRRRWGGAIIEPWEQIESTEARQQCILQEIAANTPAGIYVETVVRFGTAEAELADLVTEKNATLILAARKRPWTRLRDWRSRFPVSVPVPLAEVSCGGAEPGLRVPSPRDKELPHRKPLHALERSEEKP